MGAVRPFRMEKLIAGVLLAESVSDDQVIAECEKLWGGIDHRSSIIPFDFTSYYDQEMGGGIRRFYLSFGKLIPPEKLSRIKIESNRLEDDFIDSGNRLVNIDPGLLSLTRLILASTKDAGHRIPLSDGIFGEVTLTYESGGFKTLDWTYPDYKSSFCREEMKKIREIYKKQLRS